MFVAKTFQFNEVVNMAVFLENMLSKKKESLNEKDATLIQSLKENHGNMYKCFLLLEAWSKERYLVTTSGAYLYTRRNGFKLVIDGKTINVQKVAANAQVFESIFVSIQE